MEKLILCPNCKKAGLQPFAGFVTGSYQCRKCGYVGPLFVEQEKEEKRR